MSGKEKDKNFCFDNVLSNMTYWERHRGHQTLCKLGEKGNVQAMIEGCVRDATRKRHADMQAGHQPGGEDSIVLPSVIEL